MLRQMKPIFIYSGVKIIVTHTVTGCFWQSDSKAACPCHAWNLRIIHYLAFSSRWLLVLFWRGCVTNCSSRRHSAVAAQATSVGDELCCSVMVRPRHSTPTSSALVEGSGTNWLQARFLVNQWWIEPSYLADKLSQPADFEDGRHLLSSSSPSLIICRIRGCQPSATELSHGASKISQKAALNARLTF